MAYLRDISIGAIQGEDADAKVASVVKQLNDWGRAISNEDLAKVYKSSEGYEAVTIGQLPEGANGIMIRDETGVARAIFGQFPDGTIGVAVSKPTYDVFEALGA